MPSYAAMVEECLGLLSNWTGEQAQMCTLTSAMTTGTLSFTVDQGDRLGIGLVEVDEELVYVASTDESSGTASIPAWGRAQRGSPAAAHAVGARVTTTPRYPRFSVKQKLAQAVAALYPDVPAVRLDESNTADPARRQYPLPAGARRVLAADWQAPVDPPQWVPVTHWRLDTRADTTSFPTGVALAVADSMPAGQPLKVLYAGEPGLLAAGSDDFAAVTGYADPVADLVVMAAAARLVVGPDLARVQTDTVEQSDRSATVPASAAMTASRFLRQEYQARVDSERRRVAERYPARLHYEGV